MTFDTTLRRRELIRAAVRSTATEVKWQRSAQQQCFSHCGSSPAHIPEMVTTNLATSDGSDVEMTLARQIRRQEEGRFIPPATVDMTELISLIVEPAAELLDCPDGRSCLQVMATMVDQTGLRTNQCEPEILGPRLAQQLDLVRAKLRSNHSEEVTRTRMVLLLTFISSSLADRARQIESEAADLLPQHIFIEQVIAMASAAVAA